MDGRTLSARGVLVVDDEPAVRGLLEAALRAFGWTVWVAGDGPAAVALYEEHRAAIDVVLLDVRMPGLDGPDTLTALRGLDADVRAVFMTGDPRPYTLDDLRRRGTARILDKPFNLAALSDALREAAVPVG